MSGQWFPASSCVVSYAWSCGLMTLGMFSAFMNKSKFHCSQGFEGESSYHFTEYEPEYVSKLLSGVYSSVYVVFNGYSV